MRILFLLFGLCLACLTTLPLQAQKRGGYANTRNPYYVEGYVTGGVSIGAMNYFGDVYSTVAHTRPGLSAFVSRKLSAHWHTRLELLWGRLLADDAAADPNTAFYARNLHFRNDVKELSLVGVYEIFPSYGRYDQRRAVRPYVFGGIALIHHNPKARIEGEWVELQPLRTEGQGQPGYAQPYSKVLLALPLGGGLTFSLGDRFDLSIETGLRFVQSDYIDDVGGRYADASELASPLAQRLHNRTLASSNRRGGERDLQALVNQYGLLTYDGRNGGSYATLNGFQPGTVRGNFQRDLYLFTTIRLAFFLDTGLKCPQFYKNRRTTY
ncbi:DUF6089 family protein [Eisenibacter elegans]|jgi:hypothetical protein|uniref:DUF6089 family protein n=1 Tax=Eisenibacter elegans TaxID=997 RepID=UPI0006875617|nr:DUF6089 family protein [Eisenibacter elegans]